MDARNMKTAGELTLATSDLRGLGYTIRVRYSGPLRFRLWLAGHVIRFAAWLLCATTDVDVIWEVEP